jgi:hemolysin activation/secretion protein
MRSLRSVPNPFSRFHTALCGLSLLAVLTFLQVLEAREITSFNIREYRVEGAGRLKKLEVEEAVYPYLGPARTPDDVEQARVALEKVYHEKGYQTVSVSVPEQDPRRGVIRLEVIEGKIGRLRISPTRFFLPSRIKRDVPSLAEGKVPDMNQVSREMVALNRSADLRVTPVLRQAAEPGVLDIDLNVEDKRPLHGSLELNNRYSSNTSSLRLNGALSYGNLFQKGHTGGLGLQMAPENIDDALVISGYYIARVSDGVSLLVQGIKQNSDVSTLGGAAVGGRGEIIGLRALYDLPMTTSFYQNISLGIDYKNFAEDIVIGADTISSPITYYPISINYGAGLTTDKRSTGFNTSLNFHLRGLGSDELDYSNKRYHADGNYVFLRSDVSHTESFDGGSQAFMKIQGQLSSQPLINSEQIAGGGSDSVRGYLEATSLGDNGLFATMEYRTASLIGSPKRSPAGGDEWRFHAFGEAGALRIYDALPSQKAGYQLASFGVGTRFRLAGHYNGSLDAAVPLIDQTDANAGDIRITFRSWADF